jgi:hypothetical protein
MASIIRRKSDSIPWYGRFLIMPAIPGILAKHQQSTLSSTTLPLGLTESVHARLNRHRHGSLQSHLNFKIGTVSANEFTFEYQFFIMPKLKLLQQAPKQCWQAVRTVLKEL